MNEHHTPEHTHNPNSHSAQSSASGNVQTYNVERTSSNTTEEHHRLAAQLLHKAAALHEAAASVSATGNTGLIAHYAHQAHAHMLQATEHANEAAKQHAANHSA